MNETSVPPYPSRRSIRAQMSSIDNVEASGFVQHLKLPHYVDFQADLQLIRRLRQEWFDREAALKEAAE